MTGVMIALMGSTRAGVAGPVWTPDGGATAGAPVALSDFQTLPDTASVTIICTVSASWTWSSTGNGTLSASIPSGSSGTTMTFTLTGTSGFIRQRNITLSSTSGGITRYWTITLNVDGS